MFNSSSLYKHDIHTAASCNIGWDKLKNKKILITGATGLIGTFLIDVLMSRNINNNDNITIYAMGRNQENAYSRFKEHFETKYFFFIQQDILNPININYPVDYIIHGASNTHPIAYATEPINTIMLSIFGIKSVLDFASTCSVKRTLFLSTVEIYGENRGDVEKFSEDYCGYIDCNTLRAGYPEGKRAAEALCQAYIKEKNIDVVIARCCRIFGPTMGSNDSKAIAQFIKNAVNRENITLKSNGEQLFSFCYVADICTAILLLLLKGEKGEAYNIANPHQNLSLMQIADILSTYTGKKTVFDIPSSVEASGFSKATKALLDCKKIKELGWEAKFPIKESIIKTVQILENQ